MAAYGWQQAPAPGPTSDASVSADSAEDEATDGPVDLTDLAEDSADPTPGAMS